MDALVLIGVFVGGFTFGILVMAIVASGSER